MQDLEIISIKNYAGGLEPVAETFSRYFGGAYMRKYFLHAFNQCIAGADVLPLWYLMLENSQIIGGCGVVRDDFVDSDLSPWLTALFIVEESRGQALSSRLMRHALKEAQKLGFEKVYLSTDHIRFYEKYGFEEIGLGSFKWGKPTIGRPTKIYMFGIENVTA